MTKNNWIRVYKSKDRPIYIYKTEGGYKVNAYSFSPRYFYKETCLEDCLQYVKDFGEYVTEREINATV